MTVHHIIPMPTRLAPPTCSCGWSAPLPWRCTWTQWDADTAAHLATIVHCPTHGTQTRNGAGRCPGCHADLARTGWATRRAHYPTTQPQPEETR